MAISRVPNKQDLIEQRAGIVSQIEAHNVAIRKAENEVSYLNGMIHAIEQMESQDGD